MRAIEVPQAPPAEGMVTVDLDDQAEVVRHVGYLVHEIARSMYWRLRGNVELNDLTQNGMLGLLQAASTYRPEYRTTLMSHAGTRIRGAMLDGIRDMDWIPRKIRRQQRKLSQEAENRQLTRTQMRDLLGVGERELDEVLAAGVATDMEPEDIGVEREPIGDGVIEWCLSQMSEREQTILVLYYWHEYTQPQIGRVIGLSESGVCLARRKAEEHLRHLLERHNA